MNPDDPKFTAYTLGELDDLTPADRAEIEALLASDPEAAAEAAELRAFAARLRAELPGEEAGALREEQRAAVFSAAAEAETGEKRIVRFPRRAVVWTAIAACLAVSVSMALLFSGMQVERKDRRDLHAEALIHLSPSPDLAVANAEAAPSDRGAVAALTAPAAPLGESVLAPMATPTPLFAATAPTMQEAVTFTIPSEKPVAKNESTLSLPEGWARTGVEFRQPEEPDGMMREEMAMLAKLTVSRSPAPARPAAIRSASPGDEFTLANRAEGLPLPSGDGLAMPAASAAPAGAPAAWAFKDQVGDKRAEFGRLESELDPSGVPSFEALADNAFLTARQNPLSTFSIDVDTASYSMVRRFLNDQRQPPKGSVRIEELLNYFTYDYPQPKGDAPFSAAMEVAACPWTPDHRLVRIGLKGREIAKDKRPPSNLVFLIDVSGSMRPHNKLPLLQESLGMLIDELGDDDQVAMVVYAGSSGCVLEPTRDKSKMRAALGKLEAGGSTNGGSGLQLAYSLAARGFIKGGTNRVILATDGDWNVGITSRNGLLDLIQRKAKSGVFLTVLGVGMDNLKDSMLVKLAGTGNGNYAYLDTVLEAKKVLVEQLSGTLVTIAKDVKIQVEFNPAQVGAYRLLGYEKRMLKKEDFNDDKKDAGEIGAGHTVTALYEIVPAGLKLADGRKPVDALKYQPDPGASSPEVSPQPDESHLIPANNAGDTFLNGYKLVKKAEKAEQGVNFVDALRYYRNAMEIFEHISTTWPAWSPQIVAFRKNKTSAAIARLEQMVARAEVPPLPPGSAAPSAPVPMPMPRTVPAPPRSAPEKAPADFRTYLLEGEARNPAAVPIDQKAGNARAIPAAVVSSELLTLKLRYKEPEGDTSKLLEFPLTDSGTAWEKSSTDFRFAAAVAGYGMLLRDSPHKGEATWSAVAEWAQEGKGTDATGYREEFLDLVEKARALSR